MAATTTPPKKRARAKSKTRRRGAPRPITRDELEDLYPGLVEYLERTRPNFEEDLAKLRRPRWRSPAPSARARAAGVRFDVEEVDRFLRFCRKLRHIKGRRFAGRPFVPDLWQVVFVIAPLFGWRRPDGTRLYRALFLEVPRKNGKSTLCAAIALYLLTADREPGAEVYSAAKDRDQARAVFDVARRMARASPALRRRLEIPKGATAKTIRYDATASFYSALSSDTGGAAKHGLNVHGVIIDELHVIADRELVTTLETGTGSRDQPLVAYITTAGIPGESPVWEDKRDLAIKVAEQTVELEDFLGVIYAANPNVALDGSWADPEVWADANPGLGFSLRVDAIASKAAEAEITPANLNAFLRLHLNVPTESAAGWLPLPTWDRSASIVDELDLHGARCFGGLDLASSLDLAALVLVFPDEDDRILDVVGRFWTPEATLKKRAHRDRADYELWVRDGFLTATPGETIDYDVIEDDVARLLSSLASGCEAIDYDPWGSKQLRQHLEKAGANIFELRQGFASISPPMKEAERLVVDRALRHGGNPVLRWMVSNTVTVQDPAGNIKPDRKKSRSRIDGVVALIMAISAWQRSIARGRSAYEDHELEVV